MDLITVATPIILTGIVGLVSFLFKLALSDRDKRLDALEDANTELARQLSDVRTQVAVVQSQQVMHLRELEKIERILENE